MVFFAEFLVGPSPQWPGLHWCYVSLWPAIFASNRFRVYPDWVHSNSILRAGLIFTDCTLSEAWTRFMWLAEGRRKGKREKSDLPAERTEPRRRDKQTDEATVEWRAEKREQQWRQAEHADRRASERSNNWRVRRWSRVKSKSTRWPFYCSVSLPLFPSIRPDCKQAQKSNKQNANGQIAVSLSAPRDVRELVIVCLVFSFWNSSVLQHKSVQTFDEQIQWLHVVQCCNAAMLFQLRHSLSASSSCICCTSPH